MKPDDLLLLAGYYGIEVQWRAEAKFEEDKHPRADDGKFGSGEGSAKPAVESGTSHADFQKADVVVPDEKQFAKAQDNFKKMFKRELSVGELKDLLGVEGVFEGKTIEYSVKPYGADGLDYKAVIYDGANMVAEVRRQLTTSYEDGLNGSPVVHHDLMKIEKEYQAAGTGTKLFQKQVELYQKMGVAQIDTDAAWIGQYQWARLGYEVQDPKQLDTLKEQFAGYLADKGVDKAVAQKAVDKIRSVHDLANAMGKDDIDLPEGEGFEGLKPSDRKAWGKVFLVQRGMSEGAELIPMKFDLRAKSKNLKTLAKVIASKQKKAGPP